MRDAARSLSQPLRFIILLIQRRMEIIWIINIQVWHIAVLSQSSVVVLVLIYRRIPVAWRGRVVALEAEFGVV